MRTEGGATQSRDLTELAGSLVSVVGSDGVLTDPTQRRTYECDALASHRATPGLVVLPRSTDEVAAVVRVCSRAGVPFVARGAGTGLSAGALPSPEGVLIACSRMRRIVDFDPVNQRMTVEPGVTNAEVSATAGPHDLYYAPDPSSQIVCTIGGNVAENSGGVHCLKYGFTTNHVLGLELVLADGSVVDVGGTTHDVPGYDLRGLVIGSEGTLAIATKITLQLLRKPEAVATFVADYPSPAAAGDAVSAIIAAGIVPAAVEMLDQLAIAACEDATGAGYSRDAGAALVVELDGPASEVAAAEPLARRLCEQAGATHIRVADDDAERALIWKGRKAAFAAMGRLAPDYIVQDGVIPRTALGEVLRRIAELAAAAGLRVANVFHAGDGNLHPLVLYDASTPEEEARAEELSEQVLSLCVEHGGSITGEHGVGADKACSMPKMFSADDIAVMQRLRRAFDPRGLANPDKIFPTPRLCGEKPGPYRPHPLEEAGVIERL